MLVEDTEGLAPGDEEVLRREAERGRHLTELAEGVSAALEAVDPDEGDGARALAAAAEHALSGLAPVAPELAPAAEELRDTSLRLADVATDLRRFADSLDADPARAASRRASRSARVSAR